MSMTGDSNKLFGAITILLGLGLLLSGCFEETESKLLEQDLIRPAKIAMVRPADHIGIKTFPGVTEAARKSTLTFRVSGLIEQVAVVAGQSVKKGDLIVRLDQTPYLNVVNDRQAKHELAMAQFRRQKKLFKKRITAESKLDEAKAKLKAARVALDIARDDLRYTKLIAPYSGVIAKVHIDNHQNVQAKEAITELQGQKNIDIVFNVPEDVLVTGNAELVKKTPFIIRFNSWPDRVFTARYREHDSIPDVTTRSYKVVVEMPLPKDMTVLPGMSVTVEVDMDIHSKYKNVKAMLIPVEALFEEGGKTYVWELDGKNICHKRAVTVDRIERRFVRITKGLGVEQRVIAAGVSQVYEGLRVRPLTKERGL
jgi:RND family efflux transporter MFP subunit